MNPAKTADQKVRQERPPIGDLTDLSPSRIRTVDTCGLQFKYHYVDQLPAPTDKAASIFGSVIHGSVHEWYGMDGEDSDKYLTADLPTLIAAQWPKWLPMGIWTKTRKVIEAAIDLDNVEAYIKLTRPKIKAPRQTKDFLESTPFQEFVALEKKLVAACDKLEEISWPKDENPYKAYRKSIEMGEHLQRLWRPLPRPIAVERKFLLDMDGYKIKGQLDQLRVDPIGEDAEVLVDLRDLKTGRQLLTQMEAFVQGFIYFEAIKHMDDLPAPDRVTFHNTRQHKVQHLKFDYKRHRELAMRIINNAVRRIEAQEFGPHFGSWCKMCDYKGICEEELSLWPPGTEGLTLEVT